MKDILRQVYLVKHKLLSILKSTIMLLATQLERVFILNDKGQEIRLTDPEPKWSVEVVRNFYANTYPILTTAKVSEPIILDDTVQYRFESVMGTKG